MNCKLIINTVILLTVMIALKKYIKKNLQASITKCTRLFDYRFFLSPLFSDFILIFEKYRTVFEVEHLLPQSFNRVHTRYLQKGFYLSSGKS